MVDSEMIHCLPNGEHNVHVFSALLSEQISTHDLLQWIQSYDPRVSTLLSVYCRCLRSIRLSGTSSCDLLLNAICKQTSKSSFIRQKKEAALTLEKKHSLLEVKLRDLKRERLTANDLIEQSVGCKRQFADKIQIYKKKFDEYRDEIKVIENHLHGIGFNSGLKDEALTSIQEENQKLNEELNACSKKLQEFSEFQPTNSCLNKKIVELVKEIKEYDKYFNRESL